MELENEQQVANTRAKLRGLQEHYEAGIRDVSPDDEMRLMSLRSLKRMMNQLTEEIIRFESRQKAQR